MSNISISDLSRNSELHLADLSDAELNLSGGWVLIVFAIACALLLEHD